jgi:primosomal protein N' (replication factor Y) (superfamily II helicase)
MNPMYADIILPLAVKGKYTYLVPERLSGSITVGMRVKVQFGRQSITGCVAEIHDRPPQAGKTREVSAIAPGQILIGDRQLRLWQWISDYYMCSGGEVMKAALPSDRSIEEYRPRTESYVVLTSDFTEEEINAILDKLQKPAQKQYKVLISWLELSGYQSGVDYVAVGKSHLIAHSDTTPAVLESLVKKKILKLSQKSVTRLNKAADRTEPVKELSTAQKEAFDSIKKQLEQKNIVLLHGVTSSGKTEIYIHLIAEQIKAGKQVLYLLPEIALTTQIIMRLRKHFGEVGVYHSRFNDAEKLEIWRKVAAGDPSEYKLILGVRSSVFLPFRDLGLIIVDEEHDSSYKQQDPSPRYQARDTAIMLAGIHGAGTILGSASPSIESYHNSQTGKYGLAEIRERFGNINLPGIVIANTREARKRKLMVSHFTPELIYCIDEALGRNEQVILFQNRRGFSPYIECSECGWVPACVQCAVSLTWHKGINRLVCHYCGYQANLPHNCGNCNSTGMQTKGFGTEKIEEEIKVVFPMARVARMDQDTTKSRNSFDNIIRSFEDRKTDILIGTQMISKGLDFENLTVVGILNADNLLNFPDFRAHERGFQLLEQVSGRAGRRQKPGKVVIQTGDPAHRVIRLVLRHDYINMYRLQAEERRTFNYPPFCRMIKIIIKHKDRPQLTYFSDMLGRDLRTIFGSRVLGPEDPLVSRVQLWYIKTIMLKIEKDRASSKARQLILEAIEKLEKEKGASGLRIMVDVDPY